jgi:hypothetical protein
VLKQNTCVFHISVPYNIMLRKTQRQFWGV